MKAHLAYFYRRDFVDSEIVIWGMTSLTYLYKRVHLLFKNPKNMPHVNYEKQPTIRTNVDACSHDYSR